MNQMNSPQFHNKLNSAVVALAFIGAGILILGRNLGWIDPMVTHYLVSWQMVLIIIGILCMAKRNYTGGIIMLFLGGYFLLSNIYNLHLLWPVMLIGVGVAMFFRARSKQSGWPFGMHRADSDSRQSYFQESHRPTADEGFIVSDVTFSSARHIVLEPLFKGADLDVTFGSLMIDLRRTHLDTPQTLIQLDATFSNVELYIPITWNVVVEAESTLSGFRDKRFLSQPVDTEHKLILRGDITLSNVDIKS